MEAALEDVTCYLCGESGSSPWSIENGFSALKCNGCGLVYVSPRPSPDIIDEAARTGQHETDRGSFEMTGKYRPSRTRSLARAATRMVSSEAPVRWLDVGSGHGEMVAALRRVLPAGSEVVGMEPNEAKRNSASAHGIDLVPTLAKAGDGFDVISLINVYSHVPDPVSFLRDLQSRFGSQGGDFVLETGNGAEVTREQYPGALDLPDHLSFTGEKQLALLAAQLDMQFAVLHRSRTDGLASSSAQVARMLLRRPYHLMMPYRSPFRSLTVRLFTV